MRSNKKYHLEFKFIFLFVSLLTWSIQLFLWINPNYLKIKGNIISIDWVTNAIIGLIGLIFILIFFVIKDKFAIVELDNQNINIKKGNKELSVGWFDIDSLKQIQFVSPPLYSLKLKDNHETIWFNTEARYIGINGYTIDTSDMGEFIKKKKRELGI